MNLFDGFSDDQIAVFGCVAALLSCGVLMLLSGFFRRDNRQSESEKSSATPIAGTIGLPPSAVDQSKDDRPQRRAA